MGGRVPRASVPFFENQKRWIGAGSLSLSTVDAWGQAGLCDDLLPVGCLAASLTSPHVTLIVQLQPPKTFSDTNSRPLGTHCLCLCLNHWVTGRKGTKEEQHQPWCLSQGPALLRVAPAKDGARSQSEGWCCCPKPSSPMVSLPWSSPLGCPSFVGTLSRPPLPDPLLPLPSLLLLPVNFLKCYLHAHICFQHVQVSNSLGPAAKALSLLCLFSVPV